MAAAVRLVCGPAGAGKTERLWRRWRALLRAGPGAALWLAPARRRAGQLRARLRREAPAACGAAVWAFADFADEVVRRGDPRARPLSAPQRRALVDGLVAALRTTGKLAPFEPVLETRGFTEGLLGLLDELQRQGVSADQLTDAVAPRGGAGGGAGRRLRPCAALFAAYVRELRRRDLYDPEGRLLRAAELLRQGPGPVAARAVFVDGFTEFTPPQLDILDALAGKSEELWIALPDEPGEERAELFTRPRLAREALQRLRPEVGWLPQREAASADGPPPAPPRPAGLAHLAAQLFRPLRRVEESGDAAGLSCIEAPGMLGEVRLVARRVKALLLGGAAPDDVLVVVRDLPPYADLLREVFEEYGLPVDVEGDDPLARSPAVAALLRAMRLPEDDWPFAGVAALLRNTYLRPGWPELEGQPDLPQRAEALLRLLGEPRGREAYLAAAERWAREPQPGLEDEQAEESRRRRTHELAIACLPFLRRFFRAWDGAPAAAAPADHAAWLRRFADDLGLERAAEEDPRDRAALALLWDELERWALREGGDPGARPSDRRTFQRRLAALAGAAGPPRTPRGPGRVRILSAALARHLDAEHVFVLGLGERGFPRPAPPPSLLDEPERQALRQAGVDLPGPADLMPEEMLLFYQVVTRARRGLVLSYPAVDERGQALLPGSFLAAALACFRPEAVPVERRRLLVEGYDRDRPLSPAEYRVRSASDWPAGGTALPPDLRDNLADAADLARRRFREREHTPYDGRFRDPAAVAEVGRLFGPQRVFSPTALEDYVACPFRFFLRHVLRLEPLEEPREGIEVTRRGQAVHRALARLHRALKDEGVHAPTEAVAERVRQEVARSVAEDVGRAPSPASKELWRLEGERLLRAAARYARQWEKFVAPWREKGVAPRPHLFEAEFGLPAADGAAPHEPLVLRSGDVEVRVSGRIDRVDLAELAGGGTGFWVIDYKTGRSAHHTSADLADLRRLQLTLYALAVEEVLLAGRGARPLGLAYWMVSEAGPKVALPARDQVVWLDETRRWRELRERLQGWVAALAAHIRRGAFPLAPRSEHCTQTCDFGQVCRISQARAVGKAWELAPPDQGSVTSG
jgi:ATP-dependent helicase/DNAse subunit B